MAVENSVFVVRTQRQLWTEDNSRTGVMPASKRRLCDNSCVGACLRAANSGVRLNGAGATRGRPTSSETKWY